MSEEHITLLKALFKAREEQIELLAARTAANAEHRKLLEARTAENGKYREILKAREITTDEEAGELTELLETRSMEKYTPLL